ncbi:MAG: DUF2004 domain-containing protein [Thermoflexibacter sp.]|jgi:hypothetical protein|nr:DUF2004 domain-containing protein [Thermoflexibacter sp.]
MAIYDLVYFGKIEMDTIKDYYCVNTKIGEKDIQLDINFTKKSTDIFTMDIIEMFLKNIEYIDNKNVKSYKKDFKDGGETDDYIEFYLDELFEEELMELVDIKLSKSKKQQQLLSKLELKRVGMYPDEKNEIGYFGVFDYSIKIGNEYCDMVQNV